MGKAQTETIGPDLSVMFWNLEAEPVVGGANRLGADPASRWLPGSLLARGRLQA